MNRRIDDARPSPELAARIALRAAIGGAHLRRQGAGAPPALVAETLSLILTTATLTLAIGLTPALTLVPERRPSPLSSKGD